MRNRITQTERGLLGRMTPEEVLKWSAERFEGEIVFASSMGGEDQVIMDMMCRLNLDIPVFTLDTGRLFPETYDLIAATEKRYGRRIKLFFPEAAAVEKMVIDDGINLFYKGEAERRKCCHVRKLEPLKRALKPYDVWICGLRREQSVTRHEVDIIMDDCANGMLKISPLLNWSDKDVWDYIKKYNVPYNVLHDKGFPSIGCACCTRAVGVGEDIRSGRWWWESDEKKECGLHVVDGKLIRK